MRTSDLHVESTVRAAIISALQAFKVNPFYNLRECDPQAELLHAIRATLTPADVLARLHPKTPRATPANPIVRTSRVHAEMRIGTEHIDLMVLRADGEAALSVFDAGPLDVVAEVSIDDVAALIEIKACPSSIAKQHASFIKDLRRLSRLTAGLTHCHGFFVAFDKSLHLTGSSSAAHPRFDWVNVIDPDPAGSVEAHWLDAQGSPCMRRGRVQ